MKETFIIDFTEEGRAQERNIDMRETLIGCLSHASWLETEPATLGYTGRHTDQASHTTQGRKCKEFKDHTI